MIFYLSENKLENLCLEYNLESQTFKSYLKKVFQSVEIEKKGVSFRLINENKEITEHYQKILKKLDETGVFHTLSSVSHVMPYHYYSLAGRLKYIGEECPKKFQQGSVLKYIVIPFDRELLEEITIQCSVENILILGREKCGDTFIYRQNSLGDLISGVSCGTMMIFLTEIVGNCGKGSPLIIRI